MTIQYGKATAAVQDERTPSKPPSLRIPGEPTAFQRNESWIFGVSSVLFFLAFWQFCASMRFVSELFLPGPTDIIRAFDELIRSGTLGYDIWISSQELFAGYFLAIGVGLPIGILMGWYKRVGYILDPFVTFFYATPRIALFPLFLIWFGIGLGSKIAIVFLGAFFPIVITTVAGVRNLDQSLVKAARSFGASEFDLFRTVALPGAVPFILSGLRLGLGHALIGVVVGELIAAEAGIGLMMANAGATFQTNRVFAGIIIVAGGGLILTIILEKIEKRFQSWKPSST